MNNRRPRVIAGIVLGVVALLVVGSVATARTKDGVKAAQGGKTAEVTQNNRNFQVFDQQRNVVSNFDFITTNYGIWGLDVRNSRGSGVWPRGSQNQYMFGAGAWFGALKRPPGSNELRKRVLVTYNPNSGESWCTPGSISDGLELDNTNEGLFKNRTYFSTDFNNSSGAPFENNASLTNWPIWDTDDSDTIRFNNYFGKYVNDISLRNKATYFKGPAFISEEDIFTVYKDTDLNRYEGGVSARRAEGYPLGLQIEQTMYSWGFGDYADIMFLKYNFIHPASYRDTLFQCWMGAVVDIDIALISNPVRGAANDRAQYYSEEDSLNLALQWTNGEHGEAGRGFGYLGFNFLESPAVDANNFLRKDKRKFDVTEQLGLVTFQDWPITLDKLLNEERYDFLSDRNRPNVASEPADRRMLMSTGPFNMVPGDSARIVVGVIIGATAKGGDADGTFEDKAEVVRKVRFAQSVYNNNFRAPRAPDPSVIKGVPTSEIVYNVPEEGWLPLNNAMVIQWDSTAELSVDTLEQGLDFLGYRIYRSRLPELDTYNIDIIEGQRRHPLAWKQIGAFAMPPAFAKSNTRAGNSAVFIDDFVLAEPVARGENRFLVYRRPFLANPWLEYFSDLASVKPGRQFRSNGYPLAWWERNRIPNSTKLRPLDRYDSVTFAYLTVSQFDTLPAVRTQNAPAATSNDFRNEFDKWETSFGLDTNDVKIWQDSIISMIQSRRVKLEQFRFSDTVQLDSAGRTIVRNVSRPWEETYEVRHEVIAPYMRTITQGRTFYDNGDDDRNGRVAFNVNPLQSEKLLNNVDYYYNVRAFDEGDWTLPVQSKLNGKSLGLPNVVRTSPKAARPGDAASVKLVVTEEQARQLGGIYNVRLLLSEEQRFNQMFAGRTFEVEFFRFWARTDSSTADATTPNENDYAGLYGVIMFMRDSATKQTISVWSSLLPPELCPAGQVFTQRGGAPGYFTEKSYSYVDVDTLRIDTVFTNPPRFDTTTFGLRDNRDRVSRAGTYTTNAPCFGNQFAFGVIGLAFDYEMQQWGGHFRLDTVIVDKGPSGLYVGTGTRAVQLYAERNTPVPPRFNTDNVTSFFSPEGLRSFITVNPQSFNNGPGRYVVEFLPGGTETLTTEFLQQDGSRRRATFENVPYHNVRVKHIASYQRQTVTAGETSPVTVAYDKALDLVTIPTDSLFDARIPFGDRAASIANYPDKRLVPQGAFTIAAWGWRNSRGPASGAQLARLSADADTGRAIGFGKYYVSRALSTTGEDTLDFVHNLVIAGADVVLDYAWIGRRSSRIGLRPAITRPSQLPTQDFQAGDVLFVDMFGGALGFPYDGAKVYAKVNQYDPGARGEEYTESQLEQIQVVPNPFYVTHEGVRSPFDSKIFFTRLPKVCTIRIYTTSGSLVRTIEHNEITSAEPDREALDVWNLYSSNNQRVASQMLIAVIEAPNGASVTRKFSVVVGPARLIGETD